MTSILVINAHSSRNAGDAALTLATLQQLRQNFPNCQITLAMDDPDQPDPNVNVVPSLFAWVKSAGNDHSTHWIKANLLLLPFATLTPLLSNIIFHRAFFNFTPATLRPLLRAYLSADIVVSAPGGFLYSSGLGLTLIISVFILGLAWVANKPFYIFPQSIGPLAHSWEFRLLRWILRKARIIMVREKVSLDLLDRCNLKHERLYLIPDMALSFEASPVADAVEWLKNQGVNPMKDRPLLGLTAMDWGGQNPNFTRQNEYEIACAVAINRFLVAHGGKVVLFSQVLGPTITHDDRIPARHIASQLNYLGRQSMVVEQELSPTLLKSVYGQMDIFIGTRMHSNIFALSGGVPCLSIGYMHKTRGIAEMIGMSEWVLDINDVTSERLAKKLEELWQARQSVQQILQQTIPPLILQTQQVGSLIASDYRSLIN